MSTISKRARRKAVDREALRDVTDFRKANNLKVDWKASSAPPMKLVNAGDDVALWPTRKQAMLEAPDQDPRGNSDRRHRDGSRQHQRRPTAAGGGNVGS